MSLMFERAARLREWLSSEADWPRAVAELVSNINVGADHRQVGSKPASLGQDSPAPWQLKILHPLRKPFRETKLRLNGARQVSATIDASLIALLREAYQVQRIVLDAQGCR